MRKLLIPIQGDFVAPRFDQASELIVTHYRDTELLDELRTIIMERPSGEELCQMVVESHITDVVCGAIEESYYNFLAWKRIMIFDGVIGDWQTAMELLVKGELAPRQILPVSREMRL